MQINDADVAELVDARDLKSLVNQPHPIDLSGEIEMSSCKTEASSPAEMAGSPSLLQNNLREKFSINKVSARGKRYAYVRGTNIALVRGFSGSDDAFQAEIDRATEAYIYRVNAAVLGWRIDASKQIHRATIARARAKGRAYALTPDIIVQLLFDAEDRCAVTGLQFDYHEKSGDMEWLRRPRAPSIDRIDNARGYEWDNIRLVCTCVNIAINEWGLTNFEEVCRAFVALNPLQGLDGGPSVAAPPRAVRAADGGA